MNWKDLHETIVKLGARRGALDAEEATLLLAGRRAALHTHLGMGSYLEYLERVLGYAPRVAIERLRVAEALAELPAMRVALGDGTLPWSAVRELSRVAMAETEQEWIDAARGKTVRQVEQLVSGLSRGDRPGDPTDESVVRHRLSFEVTGETLALFREAQVRVRREVGGSVDDDLLLQQIARTVLGGPTDAGRASYQIAVSVCPRCECGAIDGGGEPVTVDPIVVEQAECDGQHTHGGTRATQAVAPATRREVMRRDHGKCRVPGCRSTAWVDVHHIVPKSCGGGHEADNLVVVCGAHHAAIHRGTLILEGAATDLVARHADGSRYGGVASPVAAERFSVAFRALRQLGFKETETRERIEKARAHVGPAARTEDAIRAALRAA